eukprot:scaffold181038_cov40-Prasinocladus_malaysianus.AAC.3
MVLTAVASQGISSIAVGYVYATVKRIDYLHLAPTLINDIQRATGGSVKAQSIPQGRSSILRSCCLEQKRNYAFEGIDR